jgi:Zn-dependent M28 family amino/carboxypeptidase
MTAPARDKTSGMAVGAARPLAALGSALAALLLSGCTTEPEQPGVAQALQTVQASDFLKYIETLASDDFEGRSVGTEGGAKTVDYLATEFKRIGLMPGNPDGTYLQAVPLIGYRSAPSISISVGGRRMDLRFPDDFVAFSYERQPEVQVTRSELVFVGYGVTAPEYFWDDYKGADLKGKTLLMLINDPQIPDPADPARLDDKVFRGRAMTYYGRWTYKYEVAAAVGADGVLIVHETATAGYPYAVVINSWGRENFDLRRDGSNPHFPVVPAWITVDRAKELFAAAGLDFAALKRAALRQDFKPVDLHATVDFAVKNDWREVPSYNVVGRIPGSDPKLKDQYVIYSAHWDHFGWDRSLPGSKHDQVFHGAVDNASGVAALLELAKAYAALPQPPRRSILFIATTAEERGLLGAQYYAAHPLYPLRDTLADINIDGMNLWGRTRDVQNIGQGSSDLDAVLAAAARSQGRFVVGDRSPERGFFYRADHFEFAKAGVPALLFGGGENYIGRPSSFGKDKREEYVNQRYHKVTDVVRPDWDLSGAVEDIELLFRTGYTVAQRDAFPQWKAGAEFKSQRDAMMRN